MLSNVRAFLRKRAQKKASATQTQPSEPQISALVDSGSRVVLAVSDNAAAISFLNECTMDTHHQLNVKWPKHLDGLPFPINMKSYARWSWDILGRRFEPTRPDVLTPQLEKKSRLAVSKMYTVITIMNSISVARARQLTGIDLQETVYITKKIQAHAFRERNYDESAIFEFPYVLQHADFADLTYREAAEDIILRAKLDDDLLAKTELLRMTYFDRLKSVTELSELYPLLESFYREGFTNSYV